MAKTLSYICVSAKALEERIQYLLDKIKEKRKASLVEKIDALEERFSTSWLFWRRKWSRERIDKWFENEYPCDHFFLANAYWEHEEDLKKLLRICKNATNDDVYLTAEDAANVWS